MTYPLPAVLVSCGSAERSNLITVAWTGILCSDPAMCYISVREERYSHEIIAGRMEYTINLTTRDMARATDWCGVRSGRDHDKWKEAGLTPAKGIMVACPYVEESPLSIECRVKERILLGSHEMFISEVLDLIADERYIDPVTGKFDLEASGLIAYSHGGYYPLGERIGGFGWSVKKKKKQ